MAKIRNISGEDRLVPWLDRVVAADEVVEIPDKDLKSYVSQAPVWEDVTPAQSARTARKGGSK